MTDAEILQWLEVRNAWLMKREKCWRVGFGVKVSDYDTRCFFGEGKTPVLAIAAAEAQVAALDRETGPE